MALNVKMLPVLGQLVTGKRPATAAIALVAAMAAGVLPWNLAAAIVIGAVGGGVAIADLIVNKGKKDSPTNPTIKMPGGLGMLLLLFIVPFMLAACGANHPLLQPDSLGVAWQTAQPYMSGQCGEIEIYPGYRLQFGDVDGEDASQLQHGFGGIVGGCGSYAKISCWVVSLQADGQEVEQRVSCAVVERLVVQESLSSNQPIYYKRSHRDARASLTDHFADVGKMVRGVNGDTDAREIESVSEASDHSGGDNEDEEDGDADAHARLHRDDRTVTPGV